MKHSTPFSLLAVTVCSLLANEAFPAEHYPLGPGMRWTYRQHAGEAAPTEVSVEVTAALSGGLFLLATPGIEAGTLVQVENQRIYSVTTGPEASVRTLVLDFERAKGESWALPCDGEVLVEATDERVEVPAGIFTGCFRVRTWIHCLPGLGPATAWYAPGVGRVKSELDGLDGPVTEELLEFRSLGAFIRGDSNRDGKIDLSDAVSTLRWLFLGEAEPGCKESTDVDRDGNTNLTDAIYILRHLFLGGPPPQPPFPACRRTDVYQLACQAPDAC